MSSKLSKKFAAAFIAAALMLFTAINIVTDVYTEYLVNVAESMQLALLRSHAGRLSDRLRDYYQRIYRLSIDNNLRALMPDMDDAFLYSSIQSKLWDYRSSNTDIISVSLINDKGTVISYEERLGRPDDEESLFADKTLYWEMIDQSKKNKHVVLFPGDYRGKPVVHLVLGVKDYYNDSYLCTAVITVTMQKLSDNIQMEMPMDGNLSSIVDSMILVNGCMIVAHTDAQRINTVLLEQYSVVPSPKNQDYREIQLEGRGNLRVIATTIDNYGTHLVSVLDRDTLIDSINAFRRWMLTVIVLLVLLILAVEFWVLLRFAQNMKALLAGIAKVEQGDFDTRVEIPAKDEIGTIADHFNRMTGRLKKSSEQQAKHNQELLLEEEKLRKTEIKALESQINSHFLYNVLNIINYAAIENGADEVSHMIKALSETLYFTFNKSMRSVKVKHEAEWLRQYLYLQQRCHGKLFIFSVKADPDTLELPINKLLVQPFAENSIAHGFYGYSYGGHLEIRFRRLRSGRLAITVQDNGCGMPAAKTEKIRKLFTSHNPQDKMGVGIENVVFRIRRYYRDGAGLYIKSSPFTGTKVTILLGSMHDELQQE